MSDDILNHLNKTGIDYEIVECDPDLADTAEFCAHYGFSHDESANAILVVGKSEPPVYAVCVVLASTRLDVNRTVRKRLGTRKASFADARATEELTGQTIGGVTPIGLTEDLPVWVDSLVMDRERVILGGGSRDRKILASPQILVAMGADIVPDLAKGPNPQPSGA